MRISATLFGLASVLSAWISTASASSRVTVEKRSHHPPGWTLTSDLPSPDSRITLNFGLQQENLHNLDGARNSFRCLAPLVLPSFLIRLSSSSCPTLRFRPREPKLWSTLVLRKGRRLFRRERNHLRSREILARRRGNHCRTKG